MKQIIWIVMLLMVISIANAEIKVYGSNFLDETDQTWTQHTYVEFEELPSELRSAEQLSNLFVQHSSQLRLILTCEDLAAFNSNNPDNIILNATLDWSHLDYAFVNLSTSPIPVYEDGSVVSDLINTFTRQEILFTLSEGESIFFDLVTLFNESSGTVADSHCRYSISVQSINCKGCKELQYEEVVDAIDTREDRFDNIYSPFYAILTQFVEFNFSIWAIISWIIKIAVLLGAIIGLFYAIYWLYFFVKRMVTKGDV